MPGTGARRPLDRICGPIRVRSRDTLGQTGPSRYPGRGERRRFEPSSSPSASPVSISVPLKPNGPQNPAAVLGVFRLGESQERPQLLLKVVGERIFLRSLRATSKSLICQFAGRQGSRPGSF